MQTEFSQFSRGPEQALLPFLRGAGITLVPYSPLGRGFLAVRFRKRDDLAAGDWRQGNPRFQGENFTRNSSAMTTSCPFPARAARSAWRENAAAADLTLSQAEAEELEQLAPRGAAAEARYDEGMLRLLDG